MKHVLFVFFVVIQSMGFSQEIWWEATDSSLVYNLLNADILVIVGEDFDWHETTLIPKRWESWGATITYAGANNIVKGHKKKKINGKFDNSEVVYIEPELLITSINPNDFDAIFFPGGYGPKNILLDKDTRQHVVSIIQQANINQKLLLGICHGPLLFAAANIINDKNITGYRAIELPVIMAYGNYITEKVVVDQNIITGNWPYFESFSSIAAENLSKNVNQ